MHRSARLATGVFGEGACDKTGIVLHTGGRRVHGSAAIALGMVSCEFAGKVAGSAFRVVDSATINTRSIVGEGREQSQQFTLVPVKNCPPKVSRVVGEIGVNDVRAAIVVVDRAAQTGWTSVAGEFTVFKSVTCS